MKRIIACFLLIGSVKTALNAQENKFEKIKGSFGITFLSFGGDEFFKFSQ